MIAVDQERVGFGRGQCTEASIASLLGISLDAVPDLWTGTEDPDATVDDHQPHANRVRMWEWLKSEHGVMLCGVGFPASLHNTYRAWVEAGEVIRGILEQDWARFHLASGPNPDGVSHYVVCERGVVVHDPNPRRAKRSTAR